MPCGDNGEAEYYQAFEAQSENFKVLYDHHRQVESELEQLRWFATWCLEKINDLQFGTNNSDALPIASMPERSKPLDVHKLIMTKQEKQIPDLDYSTSELWKEKIQLEDKVRELSYELTLKKNMIRGQDMLIQLRERTLREIQILIEKGFWAASEPFPMERMRKLYRLDDKITDRTCKD